MVSGDARRWALERLVDDFARDVAAAERATPDYQMHANMERELSREALVRALLTEEARPPRENDEGLARVIHATITGCDDLWPKLDAEGRREWLLAANDVRLYLRGAVVRRDEGEEGL